jgi:type IV pilus assembly protein PilV
MEVLITSVILAVGLLGVAGLQLAGMRSSNSALMRTQASIAAYDLIDRMRADPGVFDGQHLSAGVVTDNITFDAWAAELPQRGLRPPSSGVSPGEVNCDTAADDQCPPRHCLVTVRWEDAHAVRGGLEQLDESGGKTMVFSICTRLPE